MKKKQHKSKPKVKSKRLVFKCGYCGHNEYVGGPGTGAWIECAYCGGI